MQHKCIPCSCHCITRTNAQLSLELYQYCFCSETPRLVLLKTHQFLPDCKLQQFLEAKLPACGFEPQATVDRCEIDNALLVLIQIKRRQMQAAFQAEHPNRYITHSENLAIWKSARHTILTQALNLEDVDGKWINELTVPFLHKQTTPSSCISHDEVG